MSESVALTPLVVTKAYTVPCKSNGIVAVALPSSGVPEIGTNVVCSPFNNARKNDPPDPGDTPVLLNCRETDVPESVVDPSVTLRGAKTENPRSGFVLGHETINPAARENAWLISSGVSNDVDHGFCFNTADSTHAA